MSRYIDIEPIEKEIERELTIGPIKTFSEHQKSVLNVYDAIKKTPTAAVEKVRHGVWKDVFEERVYALSRKYAHKRVCSICDKQANSYYSYCPNCGAKMDGGDNNAQT